MVKGNDVFASVAEICQIGYTEKFNSSNCLDHSYLKPQSPQPMLRTSTVYNLYVRHFVCFA